MGRVGAEDMEKLENGTVGPALNCKLMDMIGVSRLSIYPDWMHDKNLGTDKAPRAHTFLQIVLHSSTAGMGKLVLQ